MKYFVDARLENGRPHLRVLDAETGVVHMEWSLTRVNQMLEEGEIPKEDFLHPERYGMNLLLKNLFLLSCIESMDACEQQGCRTDQNLDLKKSHSNDADWHFGFKVEPV